MKKKLHEKFEKFVKKYNQDIDMIQLKHRHSYRVAKLAAMLAEKEKLSTEKIYLAYVIGLLHDIGRFKQVETYDSTDDLYLDHGDYGAYILFEEGLISEFYLKHEHYHIIEKAIINHNKKTIENMVDEEELLFTKIIRDADKLDIFYLITQREIVLWYEGFEVSDDIWQKFIAFEAIDYQDIKSLADQFLLYMALVFDLNFITSFKYLDEQNYIEKMIKDYNYNFTFSLEKVHNLVNEYIEKKLEGDNHAAISSDNFRN